MRLHFQLPKKAHVLPPTARKVSTAAASPVSEFQGLRSARVHFVVSYPKRPLCYPKGFRLFKIRRTSQFQGQASNADTLEAEFRTGQIKGVHHVALLTDDLEKSLQFYEGILGLTVNKDRPHSKLPYRGAWLNIGPEMIHLMELPNPDTWGDRPEHGGRDRHFCIGLDEGSIEPLAQKLDRNGIKYTRSKSGRQAIFFRDPDENCLEAVELPDWR